MRSIAFLTPLALGLALLVGCVSVHPTVLPSGSPLPEEFLYRDGKLAVRCTSQSQPLDRCERTL